MSNAEHEQTINGVPGRMFARHVRDAALGTFTSQTWKASREYREHGEQLRMTVELRFDDCCGNGHNDFAITCDIRVKNARGKWEDHSGGAAHEEIARVFPELAPLIKWHLTGTDGPMHYLANAVFLAGDRDCWGLRAGEKRQNVTRNGLLMWELVADIHDGTMLRSADKYIGETTVPLYALDTLYSGDAPPATPVLRWQPSYKVGEGKARELDAARRAAVWPDATDAQLCADDLKEQLAARLPALLAQFRADMESCGFAWSATE